MKSLLFFLTMSIVAFSQDRNTITEFINYFEDENINPAKVYSIKSNYYATNRKVIIQLPVSYNQKTSKKYPVLYLLDGNRNIKSLIHITTTLASKHKMPEIIIVAIPAGKTRQQDYTPNHIPMHSSNNLGAANTFTQFLQNELLPIIDKDFRTNPYRILSGHSRGGLFAFNDLLNNTDLFQAYFAFSPALWAGDFSLITNATEKLSNTDIKNSFLYVNAGGDEGNKIKESFKQIKQLIDEHKLVNWYTAFHENDSHGTTPIPGHYLALRKLYANWDKPWELYDSQGLKAVKEQHELLSKEFGYKVIPDEDDLNKLGNYHLTQNNIEAAIETFKLNINYHPYSAKAYTSYAKALEANGSSNLAIEAKEKAASLIKKKNN